MHAAGWAIGWQICRRHRWVLAPALIYLAALVTLVHATPDGILAPEIIVQLTVPLWCVFALLIAVFSYGDQGDILARESAYPRRSFTLPLPTTALVGWPMALGGATIGSLWLIVSGLVLRSAGLTVEIPLIWPAVFLVALLAWTQALTWLPFPLTVLRMLVLIAALSALVAAAIVAVVFEMPAELLVAASAGLIPLGYVAAVSGVARARRGDVPLRYWPFEQRPAASAAATPQPFASPRAALAWFEWRSNLFLLPMIVMLVLLMLPLVFFLSHVDTMPMLLGLVSFALMLALAAGGSLGNLHSWARNLPAIPPFLAAHPVTNSTILAVKVHSAVLVTLAIWGMLGLGVALLLPFCRGGTLVADVVRALFESQGSFHATAVLFVIAVGVPVLTWKWVVDQFWFGLSGRYWVAVVASTGIIGVLLAAGMLLAWAHSHPVFAEWLLVNLTWLIATALALKMTAGGFVCWQLIRRELIAYRTLLAFGIGWIAAAMGLIALPFWLMPQGVASPLAVGLGAIVVMLPLVRFGLAPLALDWNRHR
jgi:hypothetical protein